MLTTGPIVRRVRLAAGLILFAYVSTHLINHALGNAGIGAMNAMLAVQKWIWQGVLGTSLLYGALLVHGGLGLWSLYARRYVGWTGREVVQLVLGLCVPPMLANHVTVTRLTLVVFDNDKSYVQELHALWIASIPFGLLQLAVLVVAWTHAAIGLSARLRLYSWWPRWRAPLLAVAVLLPTLAMLGFAQGVREEIRAEHAAGGWHPPPHTADRPEQAALLRHWRDLFLLFWGGAIGVVLVARVARRWHETRLRGVAVRYPGGTVVRIPPGLSVLDASRLGGIDHASVCGGRGRCSTCRVRVWGDPAALPAPSPSERALLRRVGVDPATVRLACQLRPRGDIVVDPWIPPSMAAQFVVGHRQHVAGEERFVAAMFIDLRDSTRLLESRLPYDGVFLVSRFVGAVARAVLDEGGVPNQFTGDGVFALFGLKVSPARACQDALRAMDRIAGAIAAQNRGLIDEGGPPLSCGIGLHCGSAIVGEIGFGQHVTLTALGDVVNVAARLQDATRRLDCDALVSDVVYRKAAVVEPPGLPQSMTVRGRTAALIVRAVRLADLQVHSASPPVSHDAMPR